MEFKLLHGCVSVREDNPRDLASRLSPVHAQNLAINCLLNQHASALCALRDI